MVNECLITFDAKRDALRVSDAVGRWALHLGTLGYLVRTLTMHYRDPSSDHRVVGRWVMTGRGAFRHAWAKEQRYQFPFDNGRKEIEPLLKSPPQVVQLRQSSSYVSCRCRVGAKPPLNLWCTPSSDYPPLMCSKGGCIPMYRLPLTLETCYLLDEWKSLASTLASIATSVWKMPGSWEAFERAETSDTRGEFRTLTLKVAAEVERETKRTVNAFANPYHIMKL